jgi:hypothetical protein
MSVALQGLKLMPWRAKGPQDDRAVARLGQPTPLADRVRNVRSIALHHGEEASASAGTLIADSIMFELYAQLLPRSQLTASPTSIFATGFYTP